MNWRLVEILPRARLVPLPDVVVLCWAAPTQRGWKMKKKTTS